MRKALLVSSLVVAVALASVPARAQDNSAAVEALFSEGKRLAGEKKFSEACPKFLASYNLEHRVGTLLNLADCYENNGQLASAWARFIETRTLAQRNNQPERAQLAADHAAALEPKLSKLTIQVPKAPPGLELRRDGAVIDPGAFGVAVAVDPGKHVLEAQAPGKKPWHGEVTVADGADQKTFEVPELADAPKPVLNPGSSTTTVEEKRSPARAIVGIGIAGLGVISLGVGTYFGVAALGKRSDSNANGNCGANGQPNDCNATGVALRDDARTLGNVSTVFIVIGGVATVGGLVLWLTAPSSSSKTVVGFDGQSIRLSGSF